ncbi:Epoxyqueuosine reductase [hydrothermal vent metagenome]|uniref:Epoxyqueuosine reductase n=1 Tax=hydrothermal vent metagenome TaxID=652676 RepID=A0A3B0ZZ65_9ZZZZ
MQIPSTPTLNSQQLKMLANDIKNWGKELGFQHVGISDTELSKAEATLLDWLDQGYHGDMEWMARHGSKRSRPEELVAGTLRVISVRLDYLPEPAQDCIDLLAQPAQAYISRYALGRDYHKLLRKRLQKLADKILTVTGELGFRVFVDSAPVLEKALAEKAGLGWIGKHTNLLQKQTGSWFFLGELYINLALPVDAPAENHCGTCTSCLDICPTNAFTAPYKLDARKCISYLTIENKGAIPEEFRSQIGNRIYGCDDCQLFCPWNRFAKQTTEQDFKPRHDLNNIELLRLFNWSEKEFLDNLQGSAIRRIGYDAWLRNIAVALGNALAANPNDTEIKQALSARLNTASDLVREHIEWALKSY